MAAPSVTMAWRWWALVFGNGGFSHLLLHGVSRDSMGIRSALRGRRFFLFLLISLLLLLLHVFGAAMGIALA